MPERCPNSDFFLVRIFRIRTEYGKNGPGKALDSGPFHAVILAIFSKFLNHLPIESEAYSEPCQTSKIERFAKIVNGKQS